MLNLSVVHNLNNQSVETFWNCWLTNNILYAIFKCIYKLSIYQI